MTFFTQWTREAVCKAQNGYCKVDGCTNRINPDNPANFHHRLPNRGYNQRKYPLYIQSIFNIAGICQSCHANKSHLFKVSEAEAEVYEMWLVMLVQRTGGVV